MSKELGILFQSPNSRQIQAARVSLGWSQNELAEAASVGVMSVRRLETLSPSDEPMSHLKPHTVVKIVTALENAGVMFKYDELPERLGIYFNRDPH